MVNRKYYDVPPPPEWTPKEPPPKGKPRGRHLRNPTLNKQKEANAKLEAVQIIFQLSDEALAIQLGYDLENIRDISCRLELRDERLKRIAELVADNGVIGELE